MTDLLPVDGRLEWIAEIAHTCFIERTDRRTHSFESEILDVIDADIHDTDVVRKKTRRGRCAKCESHIIGWSENNLFR